MAEFTRVAGGVGAVGTVHTTAQLKGFVITCKNVGGTAVNIQASTGIDGVVESVVREVSPLVYEVKNANGGVVSIIVDGHAVDSAILQARLRALGTVDSIDLSGTTVADASALTLA